MIKFTLLQNSGVSGSSQRDVRRLYISPETLRAHKLVAGDWVFLRSSDTEIGRAAQLWPRLDVQEDAVEMGDMGFPVESQTIEVVPFDPCSHPPRLLRSVTLVSLSSTSKESQNPKDVEWIKATVKDILATLKYVSKGQRFSVPTGDGLGSYMVHSIEISAKPNVSKVSGDPNSLAKRLQGLTVKAGSTEELEIYQFDWRTQIRWDGEAATTSSTLEGSTLKRVPVVGPMTNLNNSIPRLKTQDSTTNLSPFSTLGGLDTQIRQIRTLLEIPLKHPITYSLFGLKPPRGILLYGPPGTGKTALARAVASALPGCSCIVVNGPELSSAYHGETEEKLRGVFEEARKKSPCVVVLDEIDALCPKRDGDGGEVERRVVATLLTLMDGMAEDDEKEKVFVIAATNRPNSIDPALRRPGRFDRELEIGIPDAVGRKQILEIFLSKMPHSLSLEAIHELAAKTHGFVGADLSALVREAATLAIQRWHTSSTSGKPLLTADDISAILPAMRPSTMREVFVETPSVRWSDIGGQEEVKQKLRECVEWPLLHRDTFLRLGVEAPRGVLLYGPPGCSKTMTAKALATESGLNFLAVKGPELLNKYVGESERAVREVFRKARAAAPSIIFFDEVDALGSSRSDGDGPHNGVLTSLLNEMDGIEELSGVTVVGATNRPDVLDSALMRPGRLDRILYVGAPDLDARKEIFKLRLAKMAVEPGVNVVKLAQLAEGCSGAEVASICQDAALTAMNEDLNAPYVKLSHLVHSAKTVRRRITPTMIEYYENWRDQSGVRSA
ncbi:AAA family ATPase [Tremella mesenterica]|uniref:AAA family ATPase n=1 Tax=Tremella mesenterica TaxID=5217 RepID=A0A4Q1BWA2_TREME|nr:AAA family ATPase [Tremella mesenterica]